MALLDKDASGGGLPSRVQMILLVLLILGCAFLFYSYMISPVRAEVTRLQAQIERLNAEIVRGRAVEAKLPEFKEEVRRQEAKLAQLRRILPEEKETAEIIRSVEKLAVQANLKIRSFTPQRTVRRDFYDDWPILIALEGNYENLGRFFEQIGRFTRIINVDNIKINSVEGNANRDRTLTATCTATTFVFRDGPTQAAEISSPRNQRAQTGRAGR